MFDKSTPIELTIKIPFMLQTQTQKIALQQSKMLSSIIHMALEHYISLYKKQVDPINQEFSIKDGCNLMRELGQGLGNSLPPHDVARNHDNYLYIYK